uniref:FAM3 metabolism regulating signaling molecule D n=1 Tax=Scophthalmus maximus TaxID=52904 RepID=A0A8D3B5H7_SCOMX
MKHALWYFAAVIAILITWHISSRSFDIKTRAGNLLGFNDEQQMRLQLRLESDPLQPKCNLSRVCPPNQFAVKITSGAANVVGPKICYEGQNIMSHVRNNVGRGLNIVVVDGETGNLDGYRLLSGNSGAVLAYLSQIDPGMFVFVASYDNVEDKLSKEVREYFVEMGSTMVQSIKYRDSWVFAGRVGTRKKLFETIAVSDEKTNIFEGWPEAVEVGGCYPR